MKPKVFEQIELKAPIDSPTFTGLPNSTTPGTTSNDTRIATTEFVNNLNFLQIKTINNPNLNNVTKTGIYQLTGTITNYPLSENHAKRAKLIVLYNVGYSTQLIFYNDRNFIRSQILPGTWNAWQEFSLGSSGTYVEKDGDTMAGELVAQNNDSYTTAQVRNITISQDEPSGGGNGDIWLRYE